jgi:hypothetical protein
VVIDFMLRIYDRFYDRFYVEFHGRFYCKGILISYRPHVLAQRVSVHARMHTHVPALMCRGTSWLIHFCGTGTRAHAQIHTHMHTLTLRHIDTEM